MTNLTLVGHFSTALIVAWIVWLVWCAFQIVWYRRTATWWVISAKRESTREKRLAQLIADSAAQRLIGPLARKPRDG